MNPPIDADTFAMLSELEDPEAPGFVQEILDMFHQETPGAIAAIATALAEGDAPNVQGHAHKLKSTSGLIGALTMSSYCARIEQAGGSGDLTGVGAQLATLEAEFSRVCDCLDARDVAIAA